VADIVINKPKFVSAGTVTSVSGRGTKPKDYTITLKNTIGNTRYGAYTNDKQTTKTVKLKESVVLESPISQTKFWKGVSSAQANFVGSSYSAGTKTSDPMLLNKKGVKYPTGYKDPQSGITLWEPPANLTANPRTPGDYREKFIEYYEKKLGKTNKIQMD